MKNGKTVVKISIVAVLAALVVLTFVSRTVYHRNLPQVSAVQTVADYVPLPVVHDTPVVPTGTWRVTGVAVAPGDQVRHGDLLFTFDTTAHDLARRSAELEIRRLEAVAEPSELDMYALELARERLAYVLLQAPPAEITASAFGQVVGLNAAAGRDTAPGVPLLTLRVEGEDRGEVQRYVVPGDAVFYMGGQGHYVFVVGSRMGILGREDYVSMVNVNVVRDNGQLVAINPVDSWVNLREVKVARDIDGWVMSGDTVWVRER